MILGQLFGAVGSLASTYLDGKVAVQKANAEIKVKQATGEIDWDIEAIKATQNSWKDEWITLLFSIPLILAFCGDWGNQIVQAGFHCFRSDAYMVSVLIRWDCKCQHRYQICK